MNRLNYNEGGVMISFVGVDHVQLAAPPECEAEARAFYAGLLGLEEVMKPPALAARGGCWFQCGQQQIHIGVEREFRAAKKAHPALRLAKRAGFEALLARLTASGVAIKQDDEEVPGVAARFFVADPWGNRLEFLV
jgi:catechol 2,3-dioxygenase-like lactoylglutathione lyase family enzyme